jgi:xanthosine utilization system XapX-like protein
METKDTPILDDLKTPSVPEENPLFSLKNVFKPTPKTVTIVGTVIKLIAANAVLAILPLFTTNPHLATGLTVGAVVVGGLFGELPILLTKEQPLSAFYRAAEDIKLASQQTVEDHVSNIEQPS